MSATYTIEGGHERQDGQIRRCTVTNFGSIINRPHGAILSVGTTRREPALLNGSLTEKAVMIVTLICDHRVIDGVTGDYPWRWSS
jgi:pyruvate/2-oxoglutarate dehydrogenase complex dihydrolipoamide acyltransferase (E2) component